MMIRGVTLVAVLAVSRLAAPLAADAPGKVPRIGPLTSPSDRPSLLDAFRQGLHEVRSATPHLPAGMTSPRSGIRTLFLYWPRSPSRHTSRSTAIVLRTIAPWVAPRVAKVRVRVADYIRLKPSSHRVARRREERRAVQKTAVARMRPQVVNTNTGRLTCAVLCF
jgi:hypothetical protein